MSVFSGSRVLDLEGVLVDRSGAESRVSAFKRREAALTDDTIALSA